MEVLVRGVSTKRSHINTRSHRAAVLIVEPGAELRLALVEVAAQLSIECVEVDGESDALERAVSGDFELVIAEQSRLKTSVLEALVGLMPTVGIVALCEDLDAATSALALGVSEVVVQFNPERLGLAIDRALAQRTSAVLLRERSDLLKDTRERLSALERLAAIGHIAANVVHEVNNPASFILSNLDFIRDAGDHLAALGVEIESEDANIDEVRAVWNRIGGLMFAAEMRGAIEDAHIGAMRIKDIVLDMRSMSRDGGGLAIYDLTDVVRTAVRIAGVQSLCSAEIRTTICASVGVRGSAGRMIQVIINLIVNAAQAIAEVERPAHMIDIEVRRDGDVAMVTIEDTGSGMSKEMVGRIFDPFFTTKQPTDGTGLGLSIVRELVLLQNGEVTVKSELGKGACFTVRLPVARVTAVDFPAIPKPAED